MPVTEMTEWTRTLAEGRIDLSSLDLLSRWPFDDIVSQLKGRYPIVFLSRSHREKVEVGRARSVRHYRRRPIRDEDHGGEIRSESTAIFRQCLLLTGESGVLTI